MPRPLPADFIPTRRPREPSPDANKLKSYGFKEKYRVTSTVTQADLAKAEEMIVHAHQNPCMFHPDQYGTAVGVGSKKDTYMLGHHFLPGCGTKTMQSCCTKHSLPRQIFCTRGTNCLAPNQALSQTMSKFQMLHY
jgi:hypothetical protein